MPVFENFVHVGPPQLLTLENSLVVGRLDDLAVKAHVVPAEQIALLGGGGLPVPQPQQGHQPGQGRPVLVVFVDVSGGGGLVHQAQPRPDKALLLNLPHGQPAAPPALQGGPLHAEPHQQEDHVRRDAQLVVQRQQRRQVRRGQLFPQLVLHRAGQGGELGPLHGPGHIGPGVLRPLLRRRGRRNVGLGPGDEALPGQRAQGPLQALRRPAQLLAQLLRAAPAPQQSEVHQRAVAVAGLDQTPGRRAGHDDALLLRQMQDISAHSSAPLRFTIFYILHENRAFVKRELSPRRAGGFPAEYGR